MNSGELKGYWDLLAAQFQHQQPPLRPSVEDVRHYERLIHETAPIVNGQINVVMFGVTPEIATLRWPAGTRLLAVEKSRPMIDLVWPGNIPGEREVVHDNWFDVKLEDGSLDFVIGDGVLTALRYPDQYRELAGLIARRLKSEGRLIVRVFSRPAKAESFEEILADLEAGRISKFDILKWRLAMMLQTSIGEGVALDEVFRAWTAIKKKHPQLLAQAGWPHATVNTIKLYEGRTNRYTFPTVDELDEAFLPELRRVRVIVPEYDFGACCPIVVYCRQN